MDDQCDNTD